MLSVPTGCKIIVSETCLSLSISVFLHGVPSLDLESCRLNGEKVVNIVSLRLEDIFRLERPEEGRERQTGNKEGEIHF